MLITIENGHKLSNLSAPQFNKSESRIWTASGRPDRTQAWWEVVVRANGHKIIRDVSFEGKPWDPAAEGWEAEGVIWPAWPSRSEDQVVLADSPLTGVQEYWAEAGSRLRDSAKWMATVLGAALAAIVGTSPLTLFAAHHPRKTAIVVGLAGVAFLFITLFLVLQVMRPQSVSYADVQSAKGPWQRCLSKWREIVESEEDLYLPCGVKCLTSLRQSMIIEEVTLGALARAQACARNQSTSQILCHAQAARSARLVELRTACSRIATIGEYYKLRARSTRATYGGAFSGLIGTAAIVVAFVWPFH
jgi:hypothetical protein